MRFILGVVSALALLGAGAVTLTYFSTPSGAVRAAEAATVEQPTTPAQDPFVQPLTTTASALPLDEPIIEPIAELIETEIATVTKAATSDSLDAFAAPAAPVAKIKATDPAPIVAASQFSAPELAAPEVQSPQTARMTAEIQSQPELKSVTFLATVNAQSPTPPTADTKPADPIEVLYVTGGRVNMRSGPGSRYQRVATLERGTQLMVVQKGGSWHKVSGISNGSVVRGWMYGNLLSPEPVDIQAAATGN